MMTARKRGLVHFCGNAPRPSARSQKWICPHFRIERCDVRNRKGDRSIFPPRVREDSGPCLKNGPVPFSRPAFTLFELILAIALSAALLTLIGAAINLYLVRVDSSRTRVEEAQLARSILAMIADDIRGTTVYQPQDISAIAQLMASSKPFDVDDTDKPGGGAASTGGTSTAGTANVSGGLSSGSSGAAAGFGTSSSQTSTSAGSSGGSSNGEPEDTLPLGLSGTLEELFVDVTRLPRREELFATLTGYTNAPLQTANGAAGTPPPGVAPPADLKSVHYFVRPGAAVEPGSAAATSLAADAQMQFGGLVRQEIPRRLRLSAEEMGNRGLLDAGQALVAPEVAHLEFHYYNGQEITDIWDMTEEKSLPVAIEICIWLKSPSNSDNESASSYNPSDLANTTHAHEYRQTVYLPMSQISASQSGGMGDSSSSSTTSGSSTSTSGSSSSTSGSAFGGTQ